MYIVNTRIVDAEGTSYYATLLQSGTQKLTTGSSRMINYMAKGTHYRTGGGRADSAHIYFHVPTTVA